MFERMINNDFLKEGMPLPNPKPLHKITFLDNPKLYPDMYKEKFQNLDALEVNEIYDILEGSISTILERAAANEEFEKDLLKNDKILNILLRLFVDNSSKGSYLDYISLYRFNSIAVYCFENVPNLANMYIQLGYYANKYMIDKITPIGEVSQEDVTKMMLYFLRGGDPLSNIVRLNNYVIKLPNKIITDYYMFRLYETLCSDLGLVGLSAIAKSVLFDFNIITNDNENKNMSAMINAVLSLIDQNPSITRTVLIDIYNYAFTPVNGKYKGMRISLSKGLSPSEFPMLCQTINLLAMQEQIYLP
ncbi:MAG: hypothetical protein ACLR5O_00140 [Romboutsia timonensis]|uniref:hypothetical protein n=1 Tax=Romboutsia timonensis TaxID=1776391 RepID=UPI0039A00726